MNTVFNIVKNAGRDILNDDCPGLAAEMAFNFILAIFPFALFLTAIFGLLGNEGIIDQIIRSIRVVAPTAAMDLVDEVLTGVVRTSSGGLLTIGFLGTIWASSNAAMVVMKALNRAYNIEEARPFIHKRGLAILIVLLIASVIFIAINLLIFGRALLNLLSQYVFLPEDVFSTLLFVRWPVTFLTLFLMVLILYYFLPNIKTSKKTRLLGAIPGALFFCVFWLTLSWAFSLYVENFGRYNAVYGTLGAVIILLIWLYYSSLIILAGGEINSEIYKLIKQKVVEVKQES